MILTDYTAWFYCDVEGCEARAHFVRQTFMQCVWSARDAGWTVRVSRDASESACRCETHRRAARRAALPESGADTKGGT